MSKSLKQDVMNVIRKCKHNKLGINALTCGEDYCDYVEDNSYPVVECGSYSNANGLYTCYKCGKLTSSAYTNDNGRTICSKCIQRKKIRIKRMTNHMFVVDDREYTKKEVLEILKKHKEEEDKIRHKCKRCGTRYLGNSRFNMVTEMLDKIPDLNTAWGYSTTPFIRGFKVLSTCGDGEEIGLCDNCIAELLRWLKKEP